jgi:hypothetical protein
MKDRYRIERTATRNSQGPKVTCACTARASRPFDDDAGVLRLRSPRTSCGLRLHPLALPLLRSLPATGELLPASCRSRHVSPDVRRGAPRVPRAGLKRWHEGRTDSCIPRTRSVVDVLTACRRCQAEQPLLIGPAWEDNGLVFCRPTEAHPPRSVLPHLRPAPRPTRHARHRAADVRVRVRPWAPGPCHRASREARSDHRRSRGPRTSCPHRSRCR